MQEGAGADDTAEAASDADRGARVLAGTDRADGGGDPLGSNPGWSPAPRRPAGEAERRDPCEPSEAPCRAHDPSLRQSTVIRLARSRHAAPTRAGRRSVTPRTSVSDPAARRHQPGRRPGPLRRTCPARHRQFGQPRDRREFWDSDRVGRAAPFARHTAATGGQVSGRQSPGSLLETIASTQPRSLRDTRHPRVSGRLFFLRTSHEESLGMNLDRIQ